MPAAWLLNRPIARLVDTLGAFYMRVRDKDTNVIVRHLLLISQIHRKYHSKVVPRLDHPFDPLLSPPLLPLRSSPVLSPPLLSNPLRSFPFRYCQSSAIRSCPLRYIPLLPLPSAPFLCPPLHSFPLLPLQIIMSPTQRRCSQTHAHH